MATEIKTKAPTKTKPSVVPAKTIATSAEKAVVMQAAIDIKAPVNTVKVAKIPAKAVVKVVAPAPAPAPAPAAKAAPVAKAAPSTKVTPTKKAAPAPKIAPKIATKAAPKAKASSAKATASKKVVVASKPAAVLPVVQKEKIKKTKLVRDSFTMPEEEYAVLSDVKKACIAAGIEVKKSQLLRVGLVLLKKTSVSSLKTLVEALPPLKAGRPKLA